MKAIFEAENRHHLHLNPLREQDRNTRKIAPTHPGSIDALRDNIQSGNWCFSLVDEEYDSPGLPRPGTGDVLGKDDLIWHLHPSANPYA